MTRNLVTATACLLGVGVLVASLVGAGQSPAPPRPKDAEVNPKKAALSVDPALTVVVCNGVADADSGLIPLYPALPMPVMAVMVEKVHVTENAEVKAGDPIVTLDGSLAQATIREAEAAVNLAKAKVAQAEQGRIIHARSVDQQKQAIIARELEIESAIVQFDRLKKLRTNNLANESQITSANKGMEALRAGLKAEELKLEEVKAKDPKEQIAEAKAGVALAEAKLAQAREAAERYVLKAPSDGVILRVLADPGTVFGSQSRQPAVWFQPKGALVVRADIDQEFVSQVRVGQTCELQDETNPTTTWTGRVVRLARGYLPKRPAPMGDAILTTDPARTLETVIEVTSPGDNALLVGQRVRVTIKQS